MAIIPFNHLNNLLYYYKFNVQIMGPSDLSCSPQKQLQRQSRIISNSYYSRNKMSSSLPPVQRPMYTDANFYKNDPMQIQRASHQQYQLIIEFQLKRQRQKTKILQERLKNKELFIKQMKQLQDELAFAYQKCQKQLMQYKCQIQQFHTFNKNAAVNQLNPIEKRDNQIRQYLQEIAQLKHLVIRLQQQITILEKNQREFSRKKHQFQINNSQKNKNRFSSMKNDLIQGYFSPTKQKLLNKASPKKVKGVRSKTMMSQATPEQNQNISKQVRKEPQKISSFINHFLTMVDFFNKQPNNKVSPFTNPLLNQSLLNEDFFRKNSSLKHRLKLAWRWIKAVVVQWNHLKTKKVEQIKQFKLGSYIKSLLPCLNAQQIQIYVTRLIDKQMQNQAQEIKLN